MFVFINPNPQEKFVGDCTVRAISLAENKLWEEIYLSLCLVGFLESDMPSSNEVTEKFLLSLGYEKEIIRNTCSDCYTVKRFCDEHPKGCFVLGTGTHLVCVKDGDYLDSWDSGNKTVLYYFRKEK